MFWDRGTFVGRFWMAVAHDSMGVHRIPLLYPERVVCDFEHHFCCYRTVRTEGLAPSIWISTQRLHGAKTLRVCLSNVSSSTQSRVAPAASQGPHKQCKFSCKCLPYPKRHACDLLQTFRVISHLWTRPCSWRLNRNFSEGKAVRFFLLQAVAVTFEDAVTAIASRLEYNQCKVQAGIVDETKDFSIIQVLRSQVLL